MSITSVYMLVLLYYQYLALIAQYRQLTSMYQYFRLESGVYKVIWRDQYLLYWRP